MLNILAIGVTPVAMCMAIFYMIRDTKTGNIWSRNKWGTPTSTPDLYRSHANAMSQITNGKIGWHEKLWPGECVPIVVPVELKELWHGYSKGT